MENFFTYRPQVFEYAKKEFGIEPEYLWAKSPTYGVLRRRDNAKWYGIVMDIPRNRLGLEGSDLVDILVVKCGPLMTGSLLHNQGYFPAYHMNKSNWITILLDGAVPMEEIASMLLLSYQLTENKK